MIFIRKFPLVRIAGVTLLVITLSAAPAMAGDKGYTAESVKAAILGKLVSFVKWPENSAAADSSGPFIIGIVGENGLGVALEKVYAKEIISGKEVEIRVVDDTAEYRECHLLYVAPMMKDNLSDIVDFAHGMPILTVSDTDGFGESGILVNLYLENNKVRFEINDWALKNTPLTLSHHLMKASRLVTNKARGGRQ